MYVCMYTHTHTYKAFEICTSVFITNKLINETNNC